MSAKVKCLFFVVLIFSSSFLMANENLEKSVVKGVLFYQSQIVEEKAAEKELVEVEMFGAENVVSSIEKLIFHGETVFFDQAQSLVFIKNLTAIERGGDKINFRVAECVYINTNTCEMDSCESKGGFYDDFYVDMGLKLNNIDLCQQ